MSDELVVTGGRWRRSVGNALLMLFALSLPLSFVAMCGLSEPRVGLWLVVAPALAATCWWGVGQATHRLIAWRTQRRLRARLAEQLEGEGLVGLDSADPRRVAREREFWRDEQLRALVALRRRFAVDPERLDLLESVRQRVMQNDRTLFNAGIACALLIVGGGVIGFLINREVAELAAGALVGLILSAQTISCALLLLVWEGMATRRASRKERLAFEQESRRIVTMAELAGGLTLAEHEIDAALTGALSPQEAQEGALSEVAP